MATVLRDHDALIEAEVVGAGGGVVPDPVEAARQRLGPAAEPLRGDDEALSIDEAVALARS